MRWRIPQALLLVGCVNSSPTPQGSGPSAQPDVAAQPPISLSESGPLPPELLQKASWQLADRGDPMHLAVLARELGARELDAKVQAGGRAGAVALLAFEQAPDAYAERGRLCALLPRLSPPFRGQGLSALTRMLAAGPERAEESEPSAHTTCLTSLGYLQRTGLSEDERDTLMVALASLQGVN